MIDVLLATWHPPEEMLKAQVDSIRAQRGVEVNLLRREDAEGLGACGNFSALLSESHADYVAFADQDDVWMEDKLLKSVAKLRELETRYGQDVPLLVFCDGYVTDAKLNRKPGTVLSRQRVDVEGGLRLSRLLMQNFIAGNAMAFNAALRDKARPIPREALMHDAWLALVAAAFGHIGHVDEPLYCYRQHGDNVRGATDFGLRHVWNRAIEGGAAFRTRLAENVGEARAFVERFGKASPDAVRALAEFPSCGWFGRRLRIVRHGLYKQGGLRNVALMLFA